MRSSLLRTIGIVVCIFSTSTASAGFLGQELEVDWRYPDFDTTFNSFRVTVSDEVELPFGSIPDTRDDLQIDIGDDFILVEVTEGAAWGPADFNGWWFNDLHNVVPDIVGISFDNSDGVEGLDDSDFGFNANAVWGNFEGVTSTTDDYWIRIDVVFIPAPSVLAIMPLGLLLRPRRRCRSGCHPFVTRNS